MVDVGFSMIVDGVSENGDTATTPDPCQVWPFIDLQCHDWPLTAFVAQEGPLCFT